MVGKAHHLIPLKEDLYLSLPYILCLAMVASYKGRTSYHSMVQAWQRLLSTKVKGTQRFTNPTIQERIIWVLSMGPINTTPKLLTLHADRWITKPNTRASSLLHGIMEIILSSFKTLGCVKSNKTSLIATNTLWILVLHWLGFIFEAWFFVL